MIPRQNNTGHGYTYLQAETVGPGAAELIWDLLSRFEQTDIESVTCRIDAVFDRTLHVCPSVQGEGGGSSLLVVGTRDVREGPLMVNADTPLGFSFQRLVDNRETSATVQPLGQPHSSDGVRFRLGQHGILDVDTDAVPTLPAGGGVYRNVPLGQFVAGRKCSITHDRLIDRLSADDIEDGLGLFNELVMYRRRQSASELEALALSVVDWITETPSDKSGTEDGFADNVSDTRELRAATPDRIANLVGRGPGATPSGDDFLAGLVLSLQLVDDNLLARRVRELSCQLVTLAADKSTRVSAALLGQAVHGRAARPVANCLETLLTPNADVETAYQNATEQMRIGHTSGVDTLIGMLTATTMVYPLLATQR